MITIDDITTKDMDDAFELEETAGGWLVRVAIADAARLVPPGSEEDKAARERGSTVYFGTGNSPMLPRELASWRLSIWPHKPRRAVVVEMHLSAELERKVTLLRLTTVTSQAKLSYKEVPALLADPSQEGLPPLLRTARKLALGLLAKRRAEGAMVFYDLNHGWVTTEEGTIRKLKDHTETIGYVIVQELMVLTNTAVALYAAEKGLPMLYRNHEARPGTGIDRAEIQRFIDEAGSAPVVDFEAFQARANKFFEKAKYGEKLTGHVGLSAKAYTHFTSPIRRYADLMVHQQLRAHLKKQPLPHTEADFAAAASHLNDLATKERDGAREHFKARDEQRAARQIETRRLDGLNAKQFERVVKVEVRSGEPPSEALSEAWTRRLADGTVPTICMTTVLMLGLEADGSGGLKRADFAEGWAATKAETVAYLVEHTPDAVTVLMQAAALGWPAIEAKVTPIGTVHAPLFCGSAGAIIDGEAIVAIAQARASKLAAQRAAVAFLADVAVLPAPLWDEQIPPQLREAPKPVAEAGKHPVSQLMEHAQARACPPPKFDFTMKGEAHLPVVTCTASFLGQTVAAVSTSKQEAKTIAARQLLEKIAS